MFSDLNAFHMPKPVTLKGGVYACAHSLGLMLKSVTPDLTQRLTEWHHFGIQGFEQSSGDWFNSVNNSEVQLAKLVGARSSEVAITGTLTANLHSLLASFYHPKGKRNRILMESSAFSSDIIAVKTFLEAFGYDPDALLLLESPNGLVNFEHFRNTIDTQGDQIALIFLPGVQYLSGQRLPIQEAVQIAHNCGAVIGLDLAHSVGSMPLTLHDSQVDFAVWCHYKHLHGGPGAPGGLFVHEAHHGQQLPRLGGWWGVPLSERMQLNSEFTPAMGATGWKQSNVSMLGLSALQSALNFFDGLDYRAWCLQLQQLNGLLAQSLKRECSDFGEVITPQPITGHVSFQLKPGIDSLSIHHQLKEQGIICDARAPNILRFSMSPGYCDEQSVKPLITALTSALSEVVYD